MRLLELVRTAARTRHLSIRTEEAYTQWIRRFVVFHGKKHPKEMGEAEVRAFLSDLARQHEVAASTQNQALAALVFLYRTVLRMELAPLGEVVRAQRPRRLPVVLTRAEAGRVVKELTGTNFLVGSLLDGSGLRLLESLRLRVKDIDFERGEILIREPKGGRDRVGVLPMTIIPDLRTHIERVRKIHQRDLYEGFGEVMLPGALGRKYPEAGRSWGWQFVFPARKRSLPRRSRASASSAPREDAALRATVNAVTMR